MNQFLAAKLYRFFFCSAFATVTMLVCGYASPALAAPAAPSALRGVVVSTTQLALYWDDNSTDETTFRFKYTINGDPTVQYFDVPSGSGAGRGTVYVVISVGVGVSYSIDVCAYSGSAANASSYTNQPITVTTSTFGKPTIKGSYLQADGSVLLLWSDSSASEAGYLVEMRQQSVGNFQLIAAPAANNSGLWLPPLKPGVRYELRMRAFQGQYNSPSAVTDYSNIVVTDVIPGLLAPSNVVVSAPNETSLSFSFKDNNANNIGYEIEASLAGLNQFSPFYDVADPADGAGGMDTISLPDSAPPGTALDFRIRAFYIEIQDGPRTYSPYSPVASVTTPFYAPTNFYAVSSPSPYQISFFWTDPSKVEDAFELQYREAGSSENFVTRKYLDPRDLYFPYETYSPDMPGFKPGTTYEFRLRAVSGDLATAFTPVFSVTTKPGFSMPYAAQVFVGEPFSIPLTTISQVPRTSLSAQNPPSGVSLSAQGSLEGTLATPAVHVFTISAGFQGGASHHMGMVIRVLHRPQAPRLPVPVPDQVLTMSEGKAIALPAYFSDPDSESVLRMRTTLGDLDLILYNTATPQTVANFLSYVNSHRYDGALFHRSESQFVFQGGGYKLNPGGWFEPLLTDNPVPNEPGIPNAVGTVAMAKLEDLPNSATSQFFFNVNNNESNLDFQNDGFTVFARVGLASYPVLTQLALAPVENYSIPVKYGPQPEDIAASAFYNLPLTAAPEPFQTSLDTSKLVKITSIEPVPNLAYEIFIAPDPAIATASISAGSTLNIHPVAPGVTSMRVGAVDRDGQVTSHTVSIQVAQTFSEWASSKSLTGADALVSGDGDHDGLSALEEFAFVGDPARALPGERPQSGLVTTGQGTFLQLTFPVRRNTAGLTYIVEGRDDLTTGTWLPVWTSADTLSAPEVVNVVSETGFDRVTVRDEVSITTAARRFLRIRLVVP